MKNCEFQGLSLEQIESVAGGGFQGALPDYYGTTSSLTDLAKAEEGCRGDGVFHVEGNSAEGYSYGCVGAPTYPWGDGPGNAELGGAPSPYIGDEAVYEPGGFGVGGAFVVSESGSF